MATKKTKVKETSGIKRRGFASMDKERRKKIAKLGGQKAHKLGVAHEWNSREARIAGKIGGSK